MSRLDLNYPAAHSFVKDQRKVGSDVRWDGWDLVIWKYNPNGYTDTHGAFRRGRWGVQITVPVDENGIWSVPRRYIKG